MCVLGSKFGLLLPVIVTKAATENKFSNPANEINWALLVICTNSSDDGVYEPNCGVGIRNDPRHRVNVSACPYKNSLTVIRTAVYHWAEGWQLQTGQIREARVVDDEPRRHVELQVPWVEWNTNRFCCFLGPVPSRSVPCEGTRVLFVVVAASNQRLRTSTLTRR